MGLRLTRVPSWAVEVLRLTVVVFSAGVGYEVADRLGAVPREGVLGPFSGPVSYTHLTLPTNREV